MTWRYDYYLGSSDYPITGEDEATRDVYFETAPDDYDGPELDEVEA